MVALTARMGKHPPVGIVLISLSRFWDSRNFCLFYCSLVSAHWMGHEDHVPAWLVKAREVNPNQRLLGAGKEG